jgi:F420 biosynthesis protein FbiB-like protein
MLDATHLQDLIHSRRSIRRYTEAPVAAALVEQVLRAAQWAPSAHNRQPWRFAILREGPIKHRLAAAMGAQLRADRLRDGDHPAVVARDVARSYARITSAPVVIVVCATLEAQDFYPDARRQAAEALMAAQSVALATQNLLLMAHALGLGACWLCAPLFCGAVVQTALTLPAHWQPHALITLGYPANTGKTPTRKDLKEIVLQIV